MKERERHTDRQRPREREREWKGGPEISCPLQSDICSHVLNDCIPSVGDIRITLIAKRKWNYSKSDNVKVWKDENRNIFERFQFKQAMISLQGMAEFLVYMNIGLYCFIKLFFLFPSDALYCVFNGY